MSIDNKNAAPVGVFDSGVGGLTVAREIMRQLPNENLVYFGDTARVPYGSKSKDNIIRYSRQIIHILRTKGVKAIVIACNTASALALDVVREESDIPVIGVVEPGARAALHITHIDRSDWDGSDCAECDVRKDYQGIGSDCFCYRESLPTVCTFGGGRICKA